MELFWSTIKTLWNTLISLWYVWGIVLGAAIIRIVLLDYLPRWFKELKRKRWLEKHKDLIEWKRMNPRDFEGMVALIFKKFGYKTKMKGGPKDRGIDIIVKKDGKRNFIQCKRMDRVSPHAIRDFYGSIVDSLREGEKGFFVTTGEFTQEGEEFAKNKPIELINGLKLEQLAKQETKK